MLSTPTRQEIDHHTIKLVVGLIALGLPLVTSVCSTVPLTSISEAYYQAGWAQTFFIGCLFAVAAFLLSYNGYSRRDILASRVASLAALGVVLVPCQCDQPPRPFQSLHYWSAAAMFIILAYFCYTFLLRAWSKGHVQARARALVYACCGIGIILSIAILGLHNLFIRETDSQSRLTFYMEALGLISFGISWLTASRCLPLITRADERFKPFA